MKLMLLIIPTIQKTVKPAANAVGERDDAAAERVRDERRCVIPRATAKHAEPELAGELPARPEVEEVVDRAERRGRGPADQQGDQLARERRAQRLLERNGRSQPRSCVAMKASATAMNAVATAIPPPRGIGTMLTRRASGRSTIP